MSGLIPSAVAFAQGVGEDHQSCENKSNVLDKTTLVPQFEPRFSVDIFFLSLLLTILISLLAFALLHLLPYCKQHMVIYKKDKNLNEIEIPSVENGYLPAIPVDLKVSLTIL